LELRQQYYDNDEVILQQQFFGVSSSGDSFAADYYVDDTLSSSSYSSLSTSVSQPLLSDAATTMDIAIESYLDDTSSDTIIIPISIANNEMLDNNNSIRVSVSDASSKDESSTTTTTTVSTSRTSNQVKNNIALKDAVASADVSSVIKMIKKRMTNNDTSLTIIDNNTNKEARFEKDLQLTRHVILRHIDQVISVNDYIDDDDDDDDDDDNLQYKNNINNNNNNINADVAVTAPTISRILQYTLPAIGIWLCSPVLSMIDTAAVGLLAGTAQQAALNPAIAVSDYGAIVVAFMYTATTNLVAAAVREDKDDATTAAAATAATKQNEQVLLQQKRPKTITTVLTAIKLASIVGTFFSILLYTLGPRLLQLLIGTTAASATTASTTTTIIVDPIVYNSALQYVKIRALGMPAMVMIGTAQSACLGMQDVRSPLFVLLAAAVINFMGDVLLVPLKSTTLSGAAGAAWATVASQYAALLFFARWWLIKPNDGNTATAATTTTTTTTRTSTTSTRGFLSDSKLTLRSFLSLKNMNTSKVHEFLPFVIPVTTTSVSRISGYIAMSHVASSTLGTIDLAGHQIILSIFGCITPFVDALSQVAQSLVPGVFASNGHGQQQHNTNGWKKKERAIALRQTVTNFRIVGLGAGAVLVGLISCVPFVSQYFTTNKAVLERVHGAIKPVSLFLIVNGLMCAGEGKKIECWVDELFSFLLITQLALIIFSCQHNFTFIKSSSIQFTYILCNKKEHC
jgi:Na+-driven multidrug efflux pump